jgi:hypothetical protein
VQRGISPRTYGVADGAIQNMLLGLGILSNAQERRRCKAQQGRLDEDEDTTARGRAGAARGGAGHQNEQP